MPPYSVRPHPAFIPLIRVNMKHPVISGMKTAKNFSHRSRLVLSEVMKIYLPSIFAYRGITLPHPLNVGST